MTTIIYNHKEKSMRGDYYKNKGLLNYDKRDKTFSCEASDLDCAGLPNIPTDFEIKIEQNNHIKHFSYFLKKEDDEGELQYYLFTADGGYKFMIFND